MEKSMLGHAGFFTSLRKSTLKGMIDVEKGIEPETGYGAILELSEAEDAMREHRTRRTTDLLRRPLPAMESQRRRETAPVQQVWRHASLEVLWLGGRWWFPTANTRERALRR
jgi:hypothetical protein